jgi:hypothetical protein
VVKLLSKNSPKQISKSKSELANQRMQNTEKNLKKFEEA